MISRPKMLKEIAAAQAAVLRLRELCLQQGLIDEYGNPTDFEQQGRHVFVDEQPEVDPGPKRSGYVKFPVLLPNRCKEVKSFRNPSVALYEVLNTIGGHIVNRWLLHQLRSSALDVSTDGRERPS